MAVPIAVGPHQHSTVDPRDAFITGEQRKGSEVDPDHGAQKHPRHMKNLAEGVSRTPMSFQTQGTPATSPDTVIGHDDEVVAVTSPHGTGRSLAHQAMLVEAGVLAVAHEDLAHEVKSLLDTLSQTQCTLDAVQTCLLTLRRIRRAWRRSSKS